MTALRQIGRTYREMTMETVMIQQSTENAEYVRRLLAKKQPGFSAALELAVILAEQELRSAGMARESSASDGS
jgi:hypothetical protein